jgi:hypothetical protein
MTTQPNTQTVPTRGAGAGGANTNATGLPYEELTDLTTHCVDNPDLSGTEEYVLGRRGGKVVAFGGHRHTAFISASKGNTYRAMEAFRDHAVAPIHGCKSPDECFVRVRDRVMFIIEKKFQQRSGSVCEKIQTAPVKRNRYRKLFPSHDIVYMYCLSDWFGDNCTGSLEELDDFGIPYFFGSKPDYKEKIIAFMTSYKSKTE